MYKWQVTREYLIILNLIVNPQLAVKFTVISRAISLYILTMASDLKIPVNTVKGVERQRSMYASYLVHELVLYYICPGTVRHRGCLTLCPLYTYAADVSHSLHFKGQRGGISAINSQLERLSILIWGVRVQYLVMRQTKGSILHQNKDVLFIVFVTITVSIKQK